MEEKKGKGAGGIRKIVAAVLALVILVSGFMLTKEYLHGERKKAADRELAQQVVKDTEASTEEAGTEPKAYVSPIDFEVLMAKNPDTVGWITIPGTNVNYPIVQGADNDRYLYTDFEGRESQEGSVFLDFESDGDLMGHHNILYGHNMRNGSMFKDIVKYKDPEFFKAHQFFTIYTPEREIRLKAVSAYYEKAMPIMRKTRFKTRDSYDAFVKAMLAPCAYAEIPEVPIDSLYLLITCSYEVDDARTYLFAVPVDEEGDVIASKDPEAGFYPDGSDGEPVAGPAGGACGPELDEGDTQAVEPAVVETTAAEPPSEVGEEGSPDGAMDGQGEGVD